MLKKRIAVHTPAPLIDLDDCRDFTAAFHVADCVEGNVQDDAEIMLIPQRSCKHTVQARVARIGERNGCVPPEVLILDSAHPSNLLLDGLFSQIRAVHSCFLRNSRAMPASYL